MKKYILSGIVLSSIVVLYASYFQVNINETAAQFRFGKVVRVINGGGPYFKLPFDQIVKVNPNDMMRFELGFRSDTSKKNFSDKNVDPQLWELKHVSISKEEDESLVITFDENIVDVNTVMHYQVRDVKKYLTSLERPMAFIRHIAESTLRETFGQYTLESILVEDKELLQRQLRERIQQTLDRYDSGIKVVSVNLQDLHPPVEVVHSFRDVTSAREDKNTKIYKALDHRAKVIPAARGKAYEDISVAESFKEEKKWRSTGDLERFSRVKGVYKYYSRFLKYQKYYDSVEKNYVSKKLYVLSPGLFEYGDFYTGSTSEDASSEDSEVNY